MKSYTDKRRLDWIVRQGKNVDIIWKGRDGWYVRVYVWQEDADFVDHTNRSLRRAIDEAMNATRKK